jgi:hypothetical protein
VVGANRLLSAGAPGPETVDHVSVNTPVNLFYVSRLVAWQVSVTVGLIESHGDWSSA